MLKKNLSKGVYIISGPNKIKLVSGEITSIAKKFDIGEEVFIPEGKKIPLEVEIPSVVEIDNEITLNFLLSRTIPDDWDEVVEYLVLNKINALIIFGEVDTGKTFFSTYITNKLIAKNIKPSVLDCDTGQSDIGPPSTLGLVVFNKPVLFMTELKPDKIYFVGSHSPSEHFLYYICGFTKLVNYGLKNSDIVIIDTPGWVLGDGGRMLRNSEIEILSALETNFAVVLLQRNKEIEHLVKSLPQNKVIRLTVSKKASPTSVEERKKLREFVYKKYFSKIKKIEFKFEDISTDRVYFLTGQVLENKTKNSNILWIEQLSGFEGLYVISEKPLSEKEIEVLKKVYNIKKIKNVVENEFKNVIVGLLNKDNELICLGIIEKLDFKNKKISIFYPENNDLNDVKIIQFGSLRLTNEAEENGFVEPGIL
ncbi:MAG: Clp1/GlmU family protein [Endomicrobiia bacterium]